MICQSALGHDVEIDNSFRASRHRIFARRWSRFLPPEGAIAHYRSWCRFSLPSFLFANLSRLRRKAITKEKESIRGKRNGSRSRELWAGIPPESFRFVGEIWRFFFLQLWIDSAGVIANQPCENRGGINFLAERIKARGIVMVFGCFYCSLQGCDWSRLFFGLIWILCVFHIKNNFVILPNV